MSEIVAPIRIGDESCGVWASADAIVVTTTVHAAKYVTASFRREPRGAQFSVPFGQGKRSASLTQPLTLSIN